MSLSAGPGLYSQLSAVMEAVVLSAVAGLQKLVSGGPELLIRLELHAGQEAPDPDSARNQSREKMVQFASLMETLGNEALGKILNIVEEAELQGEENRSETSFIHILNHEENEHSYGVRLQSNDFNTQKQQEAFEGQSQGPCVPALMLKEDRGVVELEVMEVMEVMEVIAESEELMCIRYSCSWYSLGETRSRLNALKNLLFQHAESLTSCGRNESLSPNISLTSQTAQGAKPTLPPGQMLRSEKRKH